MPSARERAEIFQIHIAKLRRDPKLYDCAPLVQYSEGFSGAEIEQALISALHDSFFAQRELETRDIVRNLRQTVPLARTMREKVQELRRWAKERTRPVSSEKVGAVKAGD